MAKKWILFGTNIIANAQSVTCDVPANVSNFGMDGDLYSNYPNPLVDDQSTCLPVCTGVQDDWFSSSIYPGPGLGVIGQGPLTSIPVGMCFK